MYTPGNKIRAKYIHSILYRRIIFILKCKSKSPGGLVKTLDLRVSDSVGLGVL